MKLMTGDTGYDLRTVCFIEDDTKDNEAVTGHLEAYRKLLAEHIKKEGEILYPWMDRGLSMQQVGELFGKFNEVEEKSGKEIVEKYKRFVIEAEHRQEKIRQEVLR